MNRHATDIYHELSDEAIVEAFESAANPEALSVLFRRYTHLVYGVCCKYFSEEPDRQDVSIRIFQRVADRLQGSAVKNFSYWLGVVAKNECISELRERKTYREHLHQFKSQKNSDESYVENEGYHRLLLDSLSDQDVQEMVSGMMEELSADQKLCIHLFFFRELSYKEIMHETGFSYEEVKTHLQNGKRNLRIKIEKRVGSKV